MMPAIRATASASPLGTPSPRSSATTSAETSDPAGRRRRAGGDVLAGDVDHAGRARLVEVGEPLAHDRVSPCGARAPSAVDQPAPAGDLGRRPRGRRSARWRGRGRPTRCEPAPPTGVTTYGRPATSSHARSELPLARPASADVVCNTALHRRPVQRLDAEHLPDRRPDEHLEGDERADRVAGQGEDRGLLGADGAEALRLAGLHRDLVEGHGAEPGEHLLDDVVGADADPPLVTTRSARISWSSIASSSARASSGTMPTR